MPTRDHHRDATSNALEKALRCLIDAFAAGYRVGTVLIDGSPQLIRLAAQRHKHSVPFGPVAELGRLRKFDVGPMALPYVHFD